MKLELWLRTVSFQKQLGTPLKEIHLSGFGYHICKSNFTIFGSCLLAPSLANWKQSMGWTLENIDDFEKSENRQWDK